jgi:hypothetical protein
VVHMTCVSISPSLVTFYFSWALFCGFSNEFRSLSRRISRRDISSDNKRAEDVEKIIEHEIVLRPHNVYLHKKCVCVCVIFFIIINIFPVISFYLQKI